MPCYEPPPTATEIELYRSEAVRRGDWRAWYSMTRSADIQRWLCDALRGNPPHSDCLRWWELHKQYHDKE